MNADHADLDANLRHRRLSAADFFTQLLLVYIRFEPVSPLDCANEDPAY